MRGTFRQARVAQRVFTATEITAINWTPTRTCERTRFWITEPGPLATPRAGPRRQGRLGGGGRAVGAARRLAKAYAGKTPKTVQRDLNALSGMGLIDREARRIRARREVILSFLPLSNQPDRANP